MKVLLFDQYFDTLGGGERFTLQLVDFFLKRGDIVEIAWKDKKIKNLSKNRFNINIDKAIINENIYNFLSKYNLIQKFNAAFGYDLIFYISDGSIPFLNSKKNILLFQFPFKDVGGKRLMNQLKLKFIHKIICYSNFTKKFIDKEFGVKSTVLYPCLGEGFQKGLKKNLIISVGRFDNLLNCKKQDIMIKVFKELINEKKISKWKLILAGSCIEKSDFLNYLKRVVEDYPIKIVANINFEKLKALYSNAKIYWHVTGFGEDLGRFPERAEHFGISILEAMASGCVPIVFNGGGLPEIVVNRKNGFLFDNLEELKSLTIKIIENDSLYKIISKEAIKRTKYFDKEHFSQRFNELLK